MNPPCLHCRTRKADRGRRGLCQVCGRRPEVLARYPTRLGRHGPEPEPTEAELERTIAEQLRRLPPWWWRDVLAMNPPPLSPEEAERTARNRTKNAARMRRRRETA